MIVLILALPLTLSLFNQANSFILSPRLNAPGCLSRFKYVREQDGVGRTSTIGTLRSGGSSENQREPEDIVERMFGFLFGGKEEEPMGLKRMTVEKFPDQYPAEKVLQADPVQGDSKDMALIRPLLKQTCLEKRKLRLAYNASQNGWNPTAFHKGVDKKGPGVLLARTKGGAIIGGYNPKGWVGYGEYRPGLSAFLFSWRDGNTSERAIKLRKVGGAGLAVWDKPEMGPMFGSDGLTIKLSKGKEREARCKLGSYYERLPGGGSTFFSTEEPGVAELVELKVFVGVYASGETVPFDDAIPFSLT